MMKITYMRFYITDTETIQNDTNSDESEEKSPVWIEW